MIEFASGQITGRRAAQEDALDVLRLDGAPVPASTGSGGTASAPLQPGLVMVVADGMGGHVGGRVASTICARTFLETIRTSSTSWEQRLEDGLNTANEALRVEAESHPDLNGMGSTLVGAVVGEAGLGWISIGDSALYHFRGGTLTRLNEDHSFGAYLDQQARDGLMTSEAAASDRRRNHLFYALLGDQLDHFERFSGFHPLIEGDLVLLASDGLKTLSDEHIAEIVARLQAAPPEELVAELLKAVEGEDRERQDNVSVIAARISPREAASRPALGPIQRDAPTGGTPPTKPVVPPPSPPAGPKSSAPQASAGLRRLWIAGLAGLVLILAFGIAISLRQYR